jgi:large subunit ribosomal protein L17
VAPAFKDRQGGYTRIMRLGRRSGDSSEMCILEWVNFVPQPPKKKTEKKGEKKAEGGEAAKATKPAKETKEAEAKK